jgi:hypothetical protein
MTDEDLFEDGGGKNPVCSRGFTVSLWHFRIMKSLTVPLPNETLSFVDSQGSDPLTVLNLISATEACNRFRH